MVLNGVEQCSSWIFGFSLIGMALVYLATGFGIFHIAKSLIEDLDDRWKGVLMLFWPIILGGIVVVGAGYYIYRLIILPIVAATIDDLRRTEKRVNRKIEDSIDNQAVKSLNLKALGIKVTKIDEDVFKIGDLITGKPGNPGDYKCYDEGCVARVLDISSDRDHDLRVKLIAHGNQEIESRRAGDSNWVDSDYMVHVKKKTRRKKVRKSSGKKRAKR